MVVEGGVSWVGGYTRNTEFRTDDVGNLPFIKLPWFFDSPPGPTVPYRGVILSYMMETIFNLS